MTTTTYERPLDARRCPSQRVRRLFLVGFLVFVAGCGVSTDSQPETVSKKSPAARPPLRVAFHGSQNLADAIKRRWLTFSEQPIEVRVYESSNNLLASLSSTDIAIVESRWLATLIERDALVALPHSADDLSEPQTDNALSALSNTEWPWSWKRSVSYRKRLWGVPLGVPMLAWIENSSARGENSSVQSSEEADSSNGDSAYAIVNRFLNFVGKSPTQSSDVSLLFHMNSGQSKLNSPDLIAAAKAFQANYSSDPIGATALPDVAWQRVMEGSARSALGWPSHSLPSIQRENSLSTELKVRAPQRWVDSGDGLVAVISATTRQSNTSLQFLSWMNEHNQRQALGEDDSRIQVLPVKWTPRSDRLESRAYNESLVLGIEDRLSMRELQFSDAEPFTRALASALTDIVQEHVDAETAIMDCHTQWNRLAESMPPDTLKRRLAASFGLSVDGAP